MSEIKQIKDIYPGYFQKSKIFLYPLIVEKRDSANMPLETYLAWNEHGIGLQDGKLICEFLNLKTEEFRNFQNEQLFTSPYFTDLVEIDDKIIYIFDLKLIEEDFDHVIRGKYSKLSDESKLRIKEHFGAETANYAFIHSYLYPEQHIDRYASFLTTENKDIPELTKILTDLGELCSKPDYRKELLKLKKN